MKITFNIISKLQIKKCVNNIHSIVFDIPTSEHIRKKIISFSNEMHHRDLHLNCNGMIQLDHTLINKVINIST